MAHTTLKTSYSALADRLNRFPQGAPPSDLLFEILSMLFSEEEASLVSLMPIKPFTAKKAARIWKKSLLETQKILDELARRAILVDIERDGEPVYALPPPMAGFFEFSLMRVRDDIDQKVLSELFYQYMNVEEDFIRELFTRGETQGLVVTTLGTGDDEQFIDALHGNFKSNFLLHYNFPPYSVGEVGRVGPPGRREIGHGKLAWRALQAVLPASTDFPYTIRVVSEITESNGSSSMASVCGGSLSMMDAGVPLKSAVAGVAMGLILEEDGSYAILSDILGDEDHLGDMDFKVAGTENGITSLQMDIKVAGITPEIMEKALAQAKDGRIHILGEMNKALSGAADFSVHAPRIETMQIPTDKIREVIGSGGKVIREIVEVSGAKVDINDEGIIKIASPNGEAIKKAYDMIHSIVAEPEEGAIYTGTVVKIVDFGAFVNFFGKRDGLVHVSQIENRRLNHPSDVLKEGQEVKVKLLGFDDRGKVRLSMKVVDQETGEEIKKEEAAED
mgnify:CR=1 FL=1